MEMAGVMMEVLEAQDTGSESKVANFLQLHPQSLKSNFYFYNRSYLCARSHVCLFF